MQHAIPVDSLGPAGHVMAHAVEACVHCGFCLPTCPTYRVLGEEMDSPRGRIVLMKSALEGRVPVADTLPFIDRCLGCLSCVTTCPSGVRYGELLPLYRDHAAVHRQRTLAERAAHLVVHHTLPSPATFRIALRGATVARPLARLLPDAFAAMLSLAPDQVPPARPLPPFVPAARTRRARVLLLASCAQQVLAPEIGWSTLRVLARNGVDVLVPPGQGCCGALALHAGELPRARDLARANMRELTADADAIVTSAAGCGSAMKEYGVLFAGEADEDAARGLAARVRDVSEFLADLGMEPPPPLPSPLTAAYQDACHLLHAQRVAAAPRQLLRSVPGLSLVDIAEAEICCGSAGTYNLEQPALAATLGERKARHVLASGAEVAITGNIGCLVQLRAHLRALGSTLPVYHTMELIDRAYSDARSRREQPDS